MNRRKRSRLIFDVNETKKERDIIKAVWDACEVIMWLVSLSGVFIGVFLIEVTGSIRPFLTGFGCFMLTILIHDTRRS